MATTHTPTSRSARESGTASFETSAARPRKGAPGRTAGVIRQEKLAPLSERLRKLGLVSDWDFVLHLPLRYEDETRITPVGSLRPGEAQQTQGTVERSGFVATPRGQQFSAILTDGTGRLQLRFIHYYPSIQSQLQPGKTVRIFGEPREAFGGGLEIVHPRVKPPVSRSDGLPQALTPIYPLGENIQQKWLRKRIDRAMLDLQVEDLVPVSVTERLGLPRLRESLEYLHNPPAGASADALRDRTDPHWERLKFDELLAQQISLGETRRLARKAIAPVLAPRADGNLIVRFREHLPFALTCAQERVWKEIASDLARPEPMHRLVQGDVGSGKTVVAALAALRAVEAGYQAALMAPTEILAEQHFKKLVDWLTPLGIRTAWLTGRLKASEKRRALEEIASGEARIVVGTHALIQETVTFEKLGLAIVDEQHRFGVAQRLALRTNGTVCEPGDAHGANDAKPHLLMLSATPIPRTLAMSYLADLDVSVIDELPPGRTPVTTKTIRIERKNEVVALLRSVVAEGRQAYWVCPLIEESEALDLTPAVQAAEELQRALPDLKVALLHGAMTAPEKEVVMSAFASGETDLLVATTVIEVGVDVPNATLMVIEHAERFGLAQLHQLRGRVGRGAARSACLLLYGGELSELGRERLKIIRETTDGFEIARRDLQLRGPGEFLGERQSGMPLLRFADLETDGVLLEAARREAERWLREDRDRALAHARRWFSAKAEFLAA